MPLDYSIIICSFNPDERILKRCLNAVSNLNFNGLTYEIIVVDNNSNPALHKLPYIQTFLRETMHSTCILATEQGLTHARIKGIEEAKGQYVVFFDDDNEPHIDYLTNLKKLHANYPNVVAWGPGNIWVDFIDGLNQDIKNKTESYAKKYFQERHEVHMTYASIREWQACYPFGTGLCVKHYYLKEYSTNVRMGKYSAVGRKGNLLSSGEDLQIVLFCINKSAAAGISPTLKINHLIPKKRANLNYLKKLIFGTNLSYHPSASEIIEEHRIHLLQFNVSTTRFKKKVLVKYIKLLFNNNQLKTLELIQHIGVTFGSYLVINRPIPKLVIRILNSLGIDTKNLPL